MRLPLRFAIAVVAFGTLLACTLGSPLTPAPTAAPAKTAPAATIPAATSVPASPVTAATPSSTSTATAAVAAGTGGEVPSSCDAIASIVGTYMGGVATTKSLGSPQHLSCEFANAKATTIIIVNIGVGGTAAAFDALRTTSAQGGRTVTPISGLGVSAFSVSKNSVPAGVAVLTAQGLVYDVNSNLSIAKDQALIQQLMQLP